MCTWFGDEWTALKAKVYERVNVVPKPFEGVIKEVIDQIDTVCSNNCRSLILYQLTLPYFSFVGLPNMGTHETSF